MCGRLTGRSACAEGVTGASGFKLCLNSRHDGQFRERRNQFAVGAEEGDRAPAERSSEAIPELAVQAPPYLACDGFGKRNGNRVPYLVVLAAPVAVENEAVRETLQAGCLANRDRAVLCWMGVFAGFRVAETGDNGARDTIPEHPAVPAGVVLLQRPLHSPPQHVPWQVTPVLAWLDEGQSREVRRG